MPVTVRRSQPRYDFIQIMIPHQESTRFKRVARALGGTIQKQCAVQRSLCEAEAGMVETYNSLEDLIKEFE